MTAITTSPAGSRATAASGIDHAIRLSTAAAVLAVAGIAAYVCYWAGRKQTEGGRAGEYAEPSRAIFSDPSAAPTSAIPAMEKGRQSSRSPSSRARVTTWLRVVASSLR